MYSSYAWKAFIEFIWTFKSHITILPLFFPFLFMLLEKRQQRIIQAEYSFSPGPLGPIAAAAFPSIICWERRKTVFRVFTWSDHKYFFGTNAEVATGRTQYSRVSPTAAALPSPPQARKSEGKVYVVWICSPGGVQRTLLFFPRWGPGVHGARRALYLSSLFQKRSDGPLSRKIVDSFGLNV